MSVLLVEKNAEDIYCSGGLVDENSENLLCRLEDGVFYTTGTTMVMFHGDTLMRRVTEIIDRVVEASLFTYWASLSMNMFKLHAR